MTHLARLIAILSPALLVIAAPGLAPAQDYPPRQVVNPRLAEGASDVHVADLDGDGSQDVLSASEEDDKIAWYKNSGGDFSSQSIITAGAEAAQSVYSADLDGDGDQDVLSASEGNDEIAWYRNDGGGSFSEPVVVTATPFGAQDVHAGDLDGDGDQDIISASQNSDAVAWYENTGNGSFTGRKVITGNADGAQSVHAADLDGDGDLDILSASRSDEKIAWYENEGNGSFSDQKVITDSAGRATSVHAGDLDGDGDQDVVFASSFNGPVGWFENADGDGSFSERKLISEDGAETVHVSDLDNDGDQDVLTSGIGWFENTDGKGNFSEENTVDNTFSHSVYAANLAGDESPDIVAAGGDKVFWHQNQLGGAGNFSEQKLIAPSEIIRFIISVKAADIDGDGDQDILSAWAGTNPNRKSKISWNENADVPGSFLEEKEITTEVSDPKAVYFADLTGDGYPDVLIADGNKIAWHENNSGSFSSQEPITTNANGAEDVHTADIDGDGDEDVLSASRRDDKIAWYENTGSGSFSNQKIITTDANSANSVYATDLTGDGAPDVLSASGLGDTVSWYENDGSGEFSTQKVITTDVGSPQQVHAADLTGNGSPDVLSVSRADDKIAWYENTGDGSFSSQNVVSTNSGPGSSGSSVYTADVDGDGGQDILTANFDQVAWYENTDGQGSFSSGKELRRSLSTGRTVYAADITGDGSQDVIVGEKDSPNRVAWYENTNDVLESNDPPVVEGDKSKTEVGDSVTTEVLANDTDPNGNLDPSTVRVEQNPSNGTASENSNGTITYDPNDSFSGTDSYTYTVADTEGARSEEATVEVEVNFPNNPPVARNDTFSVSPGSTLAVGADEGVLANDTDPDGDDLGASLVSVPSDGDLTLDVDGSFEFVPDEGFTGTDKFRYQALDGTESDGAQVTIEVLENRPPAVAALPDTTIEEDGVLGPIGVSVTDRGTAPKDLSLRAETGNPDLVPSDSISVSGPGSDSTASVRVVPRPDSSGTAEIRLIASEELPGGEAQRDTSAFVLTVEPVDDPPEVLTEVVSDTLAEEGPPLRLTGLEGAVFRDPEGDRLSVEVTSSAPSVLEVAAQSENGQSENGQGEGQRPVAILRPQSAGEADVTLTASDGQASAEAGPFTVVVEERPGGVEVPEQAARAFVREAENKSGQEKAGEEEVASFGDTGVDARLRGVRSGGSLTAEFYGGRSETSDGDTGDGKAAGFGSTSPYRWKIEEGTVRVDSASVRFRLGDEDIRGVGAPEKVTVLVDSTGDGTLAALPTTFDDGGTPSDSTDDTLVAKGLTGFSTFRLASDSDQNPLGAQGAFEIAGTVTYPTVRDGNLSGGRSLRGVEIEATSSDTTVTDTPDSNGNYRITGLPEGDYVAKPSGIPEVQHVSTGDALRTVLAFIGQRPLVGDFQRAVADVNGDGTVNATDALLIARFDLGLIGGFEAGAFVSDSVSATLSDSSRSGISLRVAETGDVRLDGGGTGGSGTTLAASTLSPGQGAPRQGAAAAKASSGESGAVVEAGKTFEVPVRIGQAATVGAYQMRVSYDADIASFEGAEAAQESLAHSGVLTNASEAGASEDGTVQVSWFDRSGESALDLSKGSRLITLQFTASEGAAEMTFAPEVTGGEIVGPAAAPISAGVELQAVRVGAAAPEEFALKGSYPNPTGGQVTIEVDLPSEATVTVSVYNVLGQRVMRAERPMSAGVVQAIQLDGSGLASGQYFYRVEADLQETEPENETAEASGRLTIVR